MSDEIYSLKINTRILVVVLCIIFVTKIFKVVRKNLLNVDRSKNRYYMSISELEIQIVTCLILVAFLLVGTCFFRSLSGS